MTRDRQQVTDEPGYNYCLCVSSLTSQHHTLPTKVYTRRDTEAPRSVLEMTGLAARPSLNPGVALGDPLDIPTHFPHLFPTPNYGS